MMRSRCIYIQKSTINNKPFSTLLNPNPSSHTPLEPEEIKNHPKTDFISHPTGPFGPQTVRDGPTVIVEIERETKEEKIKKSDS